MENGVRNGYNLAVLAYAFALAGKEEQVESLLQTLDESATKLSKSSGSSMISLQLVMKSVWSLWPTFHPNDSFYNLGQKFEGR